MPLTFRKSLLFIGYAPFYTVLDLKSTPWSSLEVKNEFNIFLLLLSHLSADKVPDFPKGSHAVIQFRHH